MMHGSYKPLILTSNCTRTLTTDIEGHGHNQLLMAKRLFDIFISVLLNSMTLASDLESHSHILFPMADYVGVRVKINSL